ncbi:hypothetical protein GGR54DRAFT_35555 [Hypoxylon sp. NC1633]|nr:hypothetical protein GGR54DRAFT_35555 [Hypoxylon sp. NC1633]
MDRTSSSQAHSEAHNTYQFSWIPSLTQLSRSLPFYIVIIATIIYGSSGSQHVVPLQRDTCVSHDSPNQHAQEYPNYVSGNLNGTTLIVPISLQTARELIPAEYVIIEKAYRALLPSFPHGMYPMMAQIVHDHDIQVAAYNLSLPDFSRASLEFPFLDILGDGHTSFRWAGTSMISSDNPGAISGAESYGMTVHPASFNPACDAYKALPGGGATYAQGVSTNGTRGRFVIIEARPAQQPHGAVPHPLDFLKNITNQPVFADPRTCDYYQRLFNTSLTTGATAPVPVVGSVSANLEPLPGVRSWDGVYGWRVATPFLEPLAPGECKAT